MLRHQLGHNPAAPFDARTLVPYDLCTIVALSFKLAFAITFKDGLLSLDPVVAVAFPAGYLVDPNQDRNPDTRIELTSGNNQGNRTPDA